MKRYIKGTKEEMPRTHTEIFCRLLRCTPNDLYDWIPDTGRPPLDDKHPLHAIKPREKFNLEEELKKLTPDEIKKKLRGEDEKKDDDEKK